MRRLGSGWAVFVEAQRHPASKYPQAISGCASALVDVERRAEFERKAAHYDPITTMTFSILRRRKKLGEPSACSTRDAIATKM